MEDLCSLKSHSKQRVALRRVTRCRKTGPYVHPSTVLTSGVLKFSSLFLRRFHLLLLLLLSIWYGLIFFNVYYLKHMESLWEFSIIRIRSYYNGLVK